MRLDYSEKMTAVRDSSEKNRPVQKNRPRREPIGGLLLGALVLLVIGFAGGVLTGWFLFYGKNPQAAAVTPAQQAKAPAQAQAPQAAGAAPGQPGQPGQPVQPAPDVPLTFYKTLPSGGKGAMGSGINTKLPEVLPKSAPTAAPAAATEQPKAAPAATAKGGETKPAEKAPAPSPEKPAEKKGSEEKQAGESRYIVQVASYKDKQEAESARMKLVSRGVAAYVVESKLKDKGVWYRIRVGKHLTRQEAQQLAGKVGSGAAIVAE